MRLSKSARVKYRTTEWTNSVGIFVNEAGSSIIKRLNPPLKRLDATETRLRTVSNDCFLWTRPFRERPERTELRLDDLILAGRERGRRTPFKSYSDIRSLVFIKIISAADDDVAPRSGEELELVRFPIGSGAGAECW
jgi:hypothetical protein